MIETARARVEGWKQQLLDLSPADSLLDAKDGALCVALPGVDPVKLVESLVEGGAFAFEAGCDPATDRGWLRLPLPTPELDRRLTSLRRAARDHSQSTGVHVLWLALGLLTWCDHDGVARTAPLALWPVELERAASGVRLVASDAARPCMNPLLVDTLRRDFALVLALPTPPLAEPAADAADAGTPNPDDTARIETPPVMSSIALADLPALFDAAEGLAVTRTGWHVERAAKLGVFSFERLVLARSLEALDDKLLASPVVAQLASPTGPFAQPSIAAAEAVIRPRASVDVLAPLDADASQLAVVAAAAAGASFVVHAAPGTGSSQTIANLIAHCISHGKTVLFAANRVPALAAVRERLNAVGLGEFVLDLQDAGSTPAGAIAQLGRVLERAFRPGAGPTGDDARLADLRGALDAHVTALHKVGPFGRSLHEVLGRLVELRTTPRAALAEGDAVALDRATFERRKACVEQLAAAALPVEPVANHAWRESTVTTWRPDSRERALAALDEAAAAGAALGAAVREVAALVPGLIARTHAQLGALGALANTAAGSPRPGAELLTHLRSSRADELSERIALIRARGTGTVETPRDPLTYLALAGKHRALVAEVAEQLADAERLDAAGLWTQLRKWTHSMGPLRYVALRSARNEVRAAAVPGQLATDEAMIAALEAVIAERACRDALLGAAEPARRWFGDLVGAGVGTEEELRALDLARLDAALAWAAELRKTFDAVDIVGGEQGRAAAWRALVAQVAAAPVGTTTEPTPDDGGPFRRLADAIARWTPALAALADTTGIASDTLRAGDDHLANLRERIETLRHAIDGFREWVMFHAARHGALAAGVGPAVAAIERGDLGAEELASAWERATLLAWTDAELADTPALAAFHGAAHHAQVSAFADLDRGALALARARALVRLAERVPRAVKHHDPSSKEPGGELGLLLAAVKKPASAPPLHELLAQLPTVLPRLAPCVIGNPLALADALDPSLPAFDVVVIDDAHLMSTAEAAGILARGTSGVLVGDLARLPSDLDSVLEAAIAARLPELRLAWHYRSKHEDLFAFANARAYSDRLQILPTAQGSPELGVSWKKVDGAITDVDARTNLVEAEAVVADVLARLRDPAQRTRSIGVITLSRAQQDLIEDLLDAARKDDPALDALIDPPRDAAAAFEPLWVRHVEALCGEARDVILMSVGHAPDSTGVMSMDVSPLSRAGGSRRLTAAITRAREQLVVVSSFAPEDIHDDAAPGVRDLAAFLAFAKAGGGAARPADDTAPASPISAAIARSLVDRGWSVRHQVGTGVYKIDLAIVDPNDSERYVLAIELDGPAYASATVARDRDRLRPQLLAQLGWRLHRIWTLDWWLDPEREIQRTHAAVVTAIAASRRRAPTAGASSVPTGRMRTTRSGAHATGSTPIVRIPPKGTTPPMRAADGSGPTTTAPVAAADASGPALAAGSGPTEASPVSALDGITTRTRIKIAKGAIAIGPYTAAAIPSGRRTPDDMFAPRHLAELGKVIEQVLAAEAPIHIDLLARRVGAYFGIGRVTQRVTEQVRTALFGRGKWGEERDVVYRLDQDPGAVPAVRVAGHGPAARREIGEVPLFELAAAARIVVERASGIAPADLVRDSARLLGFARITEQVTSRVALGVELAIAREMIRLADGRASLPSD